MEKGTLLEPTVKDNAIIGLLKINSGQTLWLCTFLLTCLAMPVWIGLWGLWHSNKLYEGLSLVPIVFGLILYRNKEELVPDAFGQSKWILAILPITLTIMFLCSENDQPHVAGVFLVVNYFVLFLGILGCSKWRSFIGPILFLILMIPLPQYVADYATLALRAFFSRIFESIFITFYESYSGRHGFEFWFTNLPRPLIIAPECSGVRSLLGFIVMSLFFVVLDRHSFIATSLIIITGVTTALILNFLRILVTMQLRLHGFQEYSIGFWHGLLGIAVFVIGVLVITKLSSWISIPASNEKESK